MVHVPIRMSRVCLRMVLFELGFPFGIMRRAARDIS
jgi:hypothetical protein